MLNLTEKELKNLKDERMDILLKITNRDIAPDFYNTLKEAIECYSIHKTSNNDYQDVSSDLWELKHYFFLQILIGNQ